MNEYEILMKKARDTSENSYSPYSSFKVSAAIEMLDGSIITGTNIENASYGLTNCAERTALFTAYSMGYKKDDIKRMLILGDCKEYISPCGACRQVMSELISEEAEIILGSLHNKEVKIILNKELLPFGFKGSDINE